MGAPKQFVVNSFPRGRSSWSLWYPIFYDRQLGRRGLVWMSVSSVYVSVSLGMLPGGSALAGLPQSESGEGSSCEEGETSTAQLAT